MAIPKIKRLNVHLEITRNHACKGQYILKDHENLDNAADNNKYVKKHI